MARGIWTSDEERHKILHLRQNGMPVAAIAKHMERSINFVYRILKKANGPVQMPSTKLKTAVAETVTTAAIDATSSSAPLAAATNTKARDRNDQQRMEQFVTSSHSAAVRGAEPMAELGQSSKLQEHGQLQQSGPETVDGRGCFGSVRIADNHSRMAESHRSETLDDFWRLTDASFLNFVPNPSTSLDDVGSAEQNQAQTQLIGQPINRQKNSSATFRDALRTNAQVVSTSTSLLANLQQQRPQTAGNRTGDSTNSISGFLTRILDEIERLHRSAQSDVYDAQLLHMLLKFHAKVQLMQLQKSFSNGIPSKRARVDEMECTITNRLLREKLAKEIALIDVQANRERLELEREQIRHKTASLICRKTLLDANTSQAEVDRLFSHT
uniref:Uncharacterized protein n=1 Tax=Hyaloperonospora arabidopsidis (strain Emoy2) TaxID=559515 RepID=M4BLY8_HYAAE